MAKSLGRHVLAEIYGCSTEILNDIHQVEKIMVKAALAAGAEIRGWHFTSFLPRVSAASSSFQNLTLPFTWPELGYAAVDVFTCGDSVILGFLQYIKQAFVAQEWRQKRFREAFLITKSLISQLSIIKGGLLVC